MSAEFCPACRAPADPGIDGYCHCVCGLVWTSPRLRTAARVAAELAFEAAELAEADWFDPEPTPRTTLPGVAPAAPDTRPASEAVRRAAERPPASGRYRLARLLGALLLAACAGAPDSAPLALCPSTPALEAATVEAATALELDFTIDCEAPDAVPVQRLGLDGCDPREAEAVCVIGPVVVQHAPELTLPLADRVEAALQRWLAQ